MATKNYDSLAREDNENPINVGSAIETSDASGTPKDSPLAYSSSVITLSVPANAAEIVVRPTTDMRISEASNAATYYTVLAGTIHTFPLGRMENVYIVRDASDGTVHFYFITV